LSLIRSRVGAVAALACLTSTAAFAQAQPQAPPKIWTVALSGGLAMTSGNTDTSNINASYDIVYDPQRKNVVKSDGLFLRGTTEGELSANRTNLNVRDEYRLTPRLFVFGQNQYLRDEFKNIDYLIAPTAGLGYKLADTPTTKLTVDGSVGGVWEKNPGFEVSSSGALALGEKLVQNLTMTTTLTQSFTALWKTNNLDDALLTAGFGIAASMSTHTQLKFEVLDTYKNLPPLPTIQKNDVAVLMSVVYKN
jgi:putative salt-induced outer membrane protein YdiY